MIDVEAIGVAIVDDDRHYAEALAELLQLTADFTVVGIAGCVDDAADLMSRRDVGLALIDVHMPNGGGLRLVKRIQTWPRRPAMVLISARAPSAATLQSGIDFIAKDDIDESRLVEIVRREIGR